ncbi:hypothetical protein ACHAQA_004129 [Verticillium albo-atrum]
MTQSFKDTYAPELFIYKYLVQNPLEPVPDDANKLQISAASLESLVKHLTLPAAFIFALTRYYLPNGRGSRRLQHAGSTYFDSWYFLPVRVQVETDGANNPPADDNDSSQMNPFYKLYLPDVQRDIHRSCVGIFSRVDPVTKRFTFAAFDFMHGRWPKVALEPKVRIADVLKRHAQPDAHFGREHCVHLVYLTSATKWWTNSLSSINEQLIAYERRLQVELDREGAAPEQVLTELNRALHSIAAHLQRYLSELKSLRGIVTDLSDDYSSIHEEEMEAGDMKGFEQATRGFAQVLSQVDAAQELAIELEKKTQNILALLFNRIQISSDRLLVANGQAMQAILRAMQQDASLAQRMASDSHKLAQEMKKDSIAMKTIAIVTMFFLPGATFATLLSMPFFSENKWMGQASQFWDQYSIAGPGVVGDAMKRYRDSITSPVATSHSAAPVPGVDDGAAALSRKNLDQYTTFMLSNTPIDVPPKVNQAGPPSKPTLQTITELPVHLPLKYEKSMDWDDYWTDNSSSDNESCHSHGGDTGSTLSTGELTDGEKWKSRRRKLVVDRIVAGLQSWLSARLSQLAYQLEAEKPPVRSHAEGQPQQKTTRSVQKQSETGVSGRAKGKRPAAQNSSDQHFNEGDDSEDEDAPEHPRKRSRAATGVVAVPELFAVLMREELYSEVDSLIEQHIGTSDRVMSIAQSVFESIIRAFQTSHASQTVLPAVTQDQGAPGPSTAVESPLDFDSLLLTSEVPILSDEYESFGLSFLNDLSDSTVKGWGPDSGYGSYNADGVTEERPQEYEE